MQDCGIQVARQNTSLVEKNLEIKNLINEKID